MLNSMASEKQRIQELRSQRRVLAVAFACNPYRGSEFGVGWGWLGLIARDHRVWCIVSEEHQEDIEEYCQSHPDSHYSKVQYVYIKHHFSKSLDRIFPPYYLWQFQRQWQRQAYLKACELHSTHIFELCHLITYVGFRIPGEFYKLDCPFIWGPIGGLENTSWKLLPLMGVKGAIYYGLRNIINSLQKRYLSLPKKAFIKASENGAIIAATSSIQKEIKSYYNAESSVICEIGPPEIEMIIDPRQRQPDERLRICWSGLHHPGKALPLLLKALQELPSSNWSLDVLGDGPCHGQWRELASSLGIIQHISWHGFVARADAFKVMGNCHLFVITSLKDLTSSVLLEALSLGMPVIALNHCGFPDVITGSCGITLEIGSESEITDQLRSSIIKCYDEKYRKTLGRGAIDRAADYSWDLKGAFLQGIYSSCLKEKSNSSSQNG